MTYSPESTGRYNVAPGTEVLLKDRNGERHLAPVFWGYGPEWWDNQSPVDPSGSMFNSWWHHDRGVVSAGG